MVDRIIDDVTEEKIINFGALQYPPPKMANVLGWTLPEVEAAMKDKTSAYFNLYERGSDIADFLLDKKLFEMAKSGDMKAMEKYEKKKMDGLQFSF